MSDSQLGPDEDVSASRRHARLREGKPPALQ